MQRREPADSLYILRLVLPRALSQDNAEPKHDADCAEGIQPGQLQPAHVAGDRDDDYRQ